MGKAEAKKKRDEAKKQKQAEKEEAKKNKPPKKDKGDKGKPDKDGEKGPDKEGEKPDWCAKAEDKDACEAKMQECKDAKEACLSLDKTKEEIGACIKASEACKPKKPDQDGEKPDKEGEKPDQDGAKPAWCAKAEDQDACEAKMEKCKACKSPDKTKEEMGACLKAAECVKPDWCAKAEDKDACEAHMKKCGACKSPDKTKEEIGACLKEAKCFKPGKDGEGKD